MDWNNTATSYPRDSSIPALFEEQVKRTPDATALVFGDARVSYRQLNHGANSIAHYLRELGVGRETLVAICVDRSLEMIVGLLGILKAGGAYVPLDPNSPPQRQLRILDDTQVPIVLTSERYAARFSQHTARLLRLDRATFAGRCDNPAGFNQSKDLAYVTYTSGSTGYPKGISIAHRSVIRLVKGSNYADFDAQHTFLLISPLAFDASTFEIWGPLLNGARLAIAPPGILSLGELGECVRRYQVSTMFLTTGLFHQVVEYQLATLTSVRQLLTGGDVLSPFHVRKAVRGLPGCRVIPCYGPTENTTFTTCYPLAGTDFGDRVPIGRPISNTQVYVLNKAQQLVPVGVAGELYIGGDGLAREYWRRPDLTRKKFVDVELSPNIVTRLYRSGDQVRWHANGYLEFLGRLDQQVKIRGFRIEPGEIEHALRQHTDVADVSVQTREAQAGGKSLVAYVVLRPSCSATSLQLHDFLSFQLPDYMIPAELIFLAELPLTANGKVDRQALLAFHSGRTEISTSGLPRNLIESKLCEIWEQVLELENVGIHHTFLELGGDSLIAMQLASRISDDFHIDFSITEFVPQGTIAQLAALIVKQQRSAPPISRSLPRPSTHTEVAPLSYPQQRLWFLHEYDPDSQAYVIPLAYQCDGPLDIYQLEKCFRRVVDRHAALRTTFANFGGVVQQRIGPPGRFKFRRLNLGDEPADDCRRRLKRYLDIEAQRPMNLTDGPLLRVTVISLTSHSHVLLLVAHHLVFDGWSEKILFRELGFLYAVELAGQSSALPPLPFQYTDFAVWQRQQTGTPQGKALRNYWTSQLHGAPALLELPWDNPRPAHSTSVGHIEFQDLPPSLCLAVRKLSTQRGTTLFVTLLAAWKALLFRYTSQEDLVVGTAVAHRTRTEFECLIGFFANTLVLRTDLSGNPPFCELMKLVQQTVHSALAHQDLPFEQVVQHLSIERNPSYPPLAQVMFVLHSVPVELPGIAVRRLPVDPGTAKFDLTLYAIDQPDRISLWFEYNSDLFAESSIHRMAVLFQQLLEAVTDNPRIPITHILPEIDVSPHRSQIVTAQSSRPKPAIPTPRLEIEKRVTKIWQELLGVERIDIGDSFFALGGHSLLAIELVAKLESEFGQRISVAQVFQHRTISSQAHLLSTLVEEMYIPSIITLLPGSTHPLVLMPNIGGRIFSCDALWQNWPKDSQLLAIDLERWANTNATSALKELATKCVELLTGSPLAQPYQLLGYSFGGMLAYEVARQLAASGHRVGFVGIIDTGPAAGGHDSVLAKFLRLRFFAANAPRWLANKIHRRQLLSTFKRRYNQFSSRLFRPIRTQFATDVFSQCKSDQENVAESVRERSDEKRLTRQMHYHAFHSYVPGDYGGKVTLFRAKARPLLHHFTPDAGWSRVHVGRLEIRHVPGDHTSILEEPDSQHLAREILAALEQSTPCADSLHFEAEPRTL